MKISVIIPVYNAEEYLDECITSVLNQCYTDFELLLIDDGSTDRSGEICDGFAIKDSRVTVFHKKNGGVSSARNLGLKNASGEWVTFVDSDDFISGNYFKPILEFKNQDYIIINSNQLHNNIKSIFRSYESKALKLNEFLNTYSLFTDFATPWGRFFRKSIISENSIFFDEQLNKGEDVLFNLQYIFHCQTVALSNLTSYNYRILPNTLSSKKKNVEYTENLYNRIYDALQSYSTNPEFISFHISFAALGYYLAVINSNRKLTDKVTIMEKLIDRHKNYMIKRAKGQRIHLIPLKLLIKYELIILTIFLSNLNK